MAYKVKLTQLAEADAYAAYEYIRAEAPENADVWLTGIFQVIATLTELPERCPMIPEAEELGYQAHQLLCGKRTGIYRIIFDIQDISEEGPRVRVLRIRHGARDVITAADIEVNEVNSIG